jgi:hypothetical protein
MFSIALNLTGLTVVTARESGCKFNAGYYVSKVLKPLSQWLCERGDGPFGNLMVDANNARSHKLRCRNLS